MNPLKQSLASITELPNELTRNIDVASPVGIVRLFRQSDTQIAAGYSEYPALLDEEIVGKIEHCIHALCEVLTFKGPRRVVLSGAGTSGRLSTFVCREYNRRLASYGHEPVFRPLMAGGPLALITAQEGAEDDPIQAVKDLEGVLENAERGLLFGVTCGFSAPYIAGQLEYCMDHEGMTGVLLGFNPIERARRVEVENWDKTFGDIVDRMTTHPRALFLNPVVGPEPITGSTRMKGGSATKMLLDIAIGLALVYSELIPEKAYRLPYDRNDLRGTILALIGAYERTRLEVYRQCESIGRLVKLGGESLRQEGNLYYVGKDAFGILGLIDASECPPTFGANFTDVRGFVEGGWETLMGPGKDLSDQGPLYQITPQDFARNLLPQAGPRTLVTGLGEGGSSEWLDQWLEPASEQGAKTAKVIVNPVLGKEPYLDLSIGLEIDPPGFFEDSLVFGEFAVKLVINALTTGAHVLAGKVYENRMIDLRISNNKLYYRTLGIIQKLMGVDEATAKKSLVSSIYETDEPTSEQMNAKISQYVQKSTLAKKVVPRALLLSTGRFTVAEATEALKEIPIVRTLVEKYANNNNGG